MLEVMLAGRLWFEAMIGCRRRLSMRWQETPIQVLFKVSDEWLWLLNRAHAA